MYDTLVSSVEAANSCPSIGPVFMLHGLIYLVPKNQETNKQIFLIGFEFDLYI